MSPAMNGIPLPQIFARRSSTLGLLLLKLSKMTGSYPALTRETTVWDPMNPAPPVTSIVAIS